MCIGEAPPFGVDAKLVLSALISAIKRIDGRAESGAYIVQRGDRRGVPRADVRVERRRRLERLPAEPPAVDADGKALARFGADAWAPNRTRARARAH